tara:strand:- start:1034 stop:1441 length:408 start_codon:yes stop_codon:yes gene_type:complete
MLTEVKEVIIEETTYADSAFGVTEEGDGVFFNSRIVQKMGLKGGQTVQAYLVPNFPDKRDSIPWRAMRVEVTHEQENIEVTPTTLRDRIHRLLKGDMSVMWTVTEIAEELEEDEQLVARLLAEDKSVMSTTVYFM